MSSREERIKIFKDTQKWIEKDSELTTAVVYSKKHTKIFWEDEYPDFNVSETYDTQVSVSRDRSYQAAMRLKAQDRESRVAVMNFANAFQPGGGVTSGAGAQEECLCRTSTLYPLLYRKYLRDTFYKHHHTLKTAKASDALIYTRDVVIIKTDVDLPERLPRDQWTKVDVITVAAPDLRDKWNVHVPLVGNGTYMNNAELFGYHVKRAIHVLTCAAAMGADVLVLGAFGCGAFQNDPEVVARAYKAAIGEFPKVFKKIEFAVFCPAADTRNFEVFSRVLGSGSQGQGW